MRSNTTPKNARDHLPLLLVLSTLVAGILIGTVISGSADAAPEIEPPLTDATPLVVPPPQPGQVQNQFAELARKVRPSVVSIFVQGDEPESIVSNQPFFDDPSDLFRRFFQGPDGPGDEPRRNGPGQGSGVIVDGKGYILTNNHVVARADRIQVLFADDDKRYDARLIGVDAETDLAVINVNEKEGLQPAKIGNSEAANVGDWAIAIGSPFGYHETVTVGIISAKSREMADVRSRPFAKFLQTDAAINPGNSGGPLLNISGEVIGINSAIISRTGGYDGIGFALASNIAVKTYNQIIKHGRVTRGSIGVSYGQDNPSLSRAYGAEEGGVFVNDVVDGSPAEDAGMRAEDIIVSVNGTKIDGGQKLIDVVAALSVGDTVPIEVVRDGSRLELDVTIADRLKLYPEIVERHDGEEDEGEEESVRFGITVQEIDPSTRKRMSLVTSDGILITRVERRSFADDVGLEPGDVIVAINSEEVGSNRRLREMQRTLKPGTDVAFKVMRSSGGRWVTVYPAGKLPE